MTASVQTNVVTVTGEQTCDATHAEPVDLEAQNSGFRRHARQQSMGSRLSSSSIARAAATDLPDEECYAMASSFGRACPERYVALLVTLAVEVPVSLLIGTGSDSLVQSIGLDRYTLLMAFLPLTSAISGNVGLQASTLTTRALASKHCTRTNLWKWFRTELAAAMFLAAGCGLAVFLLAFVWTVADSKKDTDLGFAITIALSQVFSISIAGVTGTLAPVFFSFVCGRDAGKWAGPLETAVQDIAGTFAVVYVAQWILIFFVKLGISPAATA